jgi:hypothetical protein
MLALANETGFQAATNVSTSDQIQRYFADRTDGLKPTNGEWFLVATT